MKGVVAMAGYSAVVSTGGGAGAKVELDSSHPGFSDPAYRERRDAIASLSVDYRPGQAVPTVDYTDREHEIWVTVSAELAPRHERFACEELMAAAEPLALPSDHVPQLSEVTERLAPLSGFKYLPVAGLAPLRDFYGSFVDQSFHSTQYLRHGSVPLYTPEPDIIHEVIGHASQLASPHFAAIYKMVGEAVQRSATDEALGFLSKVFWFTMEFGVVKRAGELKAYGAGILSSIGEMDQLATVEVRPFDIVEMGTRAYDITRFQPVLYAVGSITELFERLGQFLGTYGDRAYAGLVVGDQPAGL
ncbi:MAG: phenylalanine 4-monooxygenase [Acidimicrobiales bacterium]